MSSCCSVRPAPRVKHAAPLAALFQALADPTRLRLLASLAAAPGGELCVCHLHAGLDLSQPTVSRHLAYLRRAGLVSARRDGVWMHYRLVRPADPVLDAVFDAAVHALGHVEGTSRDLVKVARAVQAAPPPAG